MSTTTIEPSSGLPAPQLERVVDCHVQLAEPIDVGETPEGRRRLIPIVSGQLLGPLLFGRVLPGGADFQLVRGPGLTTLHARYVLQTDRGELVYLENTGLRASSPVLLERMARAEPVAPGEVYFRTAPRFETAAPRLAWLNNSVFVGTGVRYPSHVQLSFFRLL